MKLIEETNELKKKRLSKQLKPFEWLCDEENCFGILDRANRSMFGYDFVEKKMYCIRCAAKMENLAALTLTDTAIIQLGLAKPEDLIKHDEMQLPKFPTSQSRYEGIVNRTFSLTELADAELLGFLEYVEKCEIHIHDSLASKSYLRPYIAAKSRLEKLQRKI